MNEYEKSYYILFNSITDAIQMLRENRSAAAMEILCMAQIRSEEAFVIFGNEKEKKTVDNANFE